MSDHRKAFFTSQIERIETLGVDAQGRRTEPFIILVLDLLDPSASSLAAAKSSPDAVQQQLALASSKGVSPCLLVDTSLADCDSLFRESHGWATRRSATVNWPVIRVVVISDGGISFVSHRIPV